MSQNCAVWILKSEEYDEEFIKEMLYIIYTNNIYYSVVHDTTMFYSLSSIAY